ncbi:hypothetical protein ABMA27_000340 [Loxostege sticticalis]|uniref:Integrase catalytic domain-containing protein n=1 Tax=Loxostege sticticalis TaxID=481309 RepID=A0ABR3IN28_LOXSC
MDFSTKIEIAKLKGKENWATWKYNAVNGTLVKPTPVTGEAGAGDAAVSAYKAALAKYKRTESSARLMLTTNMSEETLKKVMRYTTAHEVWKDLCLEFFGLKHSKEDDIPTHMSKIKNLWNEINVEILKIDPSAKLPEVLLVCKVLDTLDDRYFNFKSSWLMLLLLLFLNGDKLVFHRNGYTTIDSLTSHLCDFERNLGSQGSTPEEALVTMPKGRQVKHNKDEQLTCNYWSGKGDRVRKRDFFTEFHEFDSGQTVLTADGTPIHALGQGTVVVESNVNGNKGMITLHEVWLVPSLKKNLFSTLAAQDRVTNSIFISTARECRLEVAGTTKVNGRRVLKGGLYKLEMKTVTPTKQWATEVNATEDSGMLQLYHERLAHQDKKHVIRVVKRELGIQLSLDKAKCEGCIFGKSHRKPFGTRERATAPGELIHADVCGPFTDSVAKNKYFVLFKDDFSSYRMVYFIKQKSEVKDKLLQMLEEAKTAGHVVKTLLTDNGGEFANEAVLGILQCRGIKHRMTMPYTPEQNGCSERENRTLVEAARSIMYARDEMPNVLWAELINTAAYVLNRTGPTRVDDKSPYELWRGKKPKISHLKIIVSEFYVHVPKQLRKKMGKKAIKGTLIGYEVDDGYRIWNGAKSRGTSRLIRIMSFVSPPRSLSCKKELRATTITQRQIRHRQRKGIDYEQTFSPVARMATVRALLSVSAKENLFLTQFDVSTAFLNGKLQEEIYMNQPDGYNDGTSRVCLLQRSLYGLKQAPRCWNSCFEEILLENGFVQCAADSCLFTKKVGDTKILITLYVDDGLITSKPASYYLGLEIARREDGSVLIKQESYTKKILERFGMSQCNPVSTPIEKGSTEAVGALAYLMTGTRPDIAYAVGIVSKKLENPTKADWLQVKRIFRYLKGTTSLGIEYKPSLTSSKVIGYSDADHGGYADTGRSTTGVVTYFCGGAISWLCKRQQSVSISTTEAEIVAASEGARELVWLQRIFPAIRLAHNPEFHKRTKHIRIRHFFVRETVQECLVDVKKTSCMDQLADIFIKAVPKPCLQRIREKLGLRLIDPSLEQSGHGRTIFSRSVSRLFHPPCIIDVNKARSLEINKQLHRDLASFLQNVFGGIYYIMNSLMYLKT